MKIEGVYTALLTPFTAEEDLDLDALQALVRHVVDEGGEGIAPLGTTGEGYAVTRSERAEILRAVRDAAGPATGLIAGVTEITTRGTVENARLAAELGYQAAMVAPPPYVLPNTAELIEHFQAVAREGGLPVVLYDYPARTGVSIDEQVLGALVDEPGIIAIKEASGDFTRVVRLRALYGDRFQIVCGADSLILDFVLWGSEAWIAGSAGVLPGEHSRLLAAARAGDFRSAREMLEDILPLLLSIEEGAYTQKLRSALRELGLPSGHPRAPLQELEGVLPVEVTELLAKRRAPSRTG
jgi:4-hydroxy-tetrahydrodipicolinate synthase